MKSKAQEWADNEGKRQERAQRLREELMSMRDESDAPKLTLEPEGPRFGVTWMGGLKIDCGARTEYATSRDQAMRLAQWIMDTFGATDE